VLKRILFMIVLLSLLHSEAVLAAHDLLNHKEIISIVVDYERRIGHHVLLPNWMPPRYDQASIRFTGNDDLTITYAVGQKHDGTIALQMRDEAVINDIRLTKIRLKNGKTAFFKEERLEGPFDYVPTDGDYVRLYFYDDDLLYSLSMGSRAISTSKMKKIIIKIAASMA
jgi:hypothetical protein